VRRGTVKGKRTREEHEDAVAEAEEEEKRRKEVGHIHAEEDSVEKGSGTGEVGMKKCRKWCNGVAAEKLSVCKYIWLRLV
jgi:hypothetical protein